MSMLEAMIGPDFPFVENGASHAEFHYLGLAKILGSIGK